MEKVSDTQVAVDQSGVDKVDKGVGDYKFMIVIRNYDPFVGMVDLSDFICYRLNLQHACHVKEVYFVEKVESVDEEKSK